MQDLQLVATTTRDILQTLPSGTFDAATKLTKDEIDQSDDYGIDWELTVTPTNPLACPLHIFASCGHLDECHWGFSFDTQGRVATLCGLKLGKRTRRIVAFGTEPIRMLPDRVVAIVEAVIHGSVTLHYRVFAGYLMKTAGVVSLSDGPHRFDGYGLPLGHRMAFKYRPWTHVESTG
jgi:hypothetical protein